MQQEGKAYGNQDRQEANRRMWRFDCCYCYLDSVTLPWDLKLKRGGRGRPLGRRVFGSLNSSKNGCMQASIWRMAPWLEHKRAHSVSICNLEGNIRKWSCGLTAVHRRSGEYWRNLLTRSIASGGSFFWKTWIKRKFWGNRGTMRKYVDLILRLKRIDDIKMTSVSIIMSHYLTARQSIFPKVCTKSNSYCAHQAATNQAWQT